MSQQSSAGAVVVDANVLLGICTKEPKEKIAKDALADYARRNWRFYAPGVISAEFFFVACQKLKTGILSEAEYEKAIEDFSDYMSVIQPPPIGEATLIKRAKDIHSGYGCSRTADCLYIALADELSKIGDSELLTFDREAVTTARRAPAVSINLLTV
jgi:predicted nucleic acid-binding protein